MSFDFNKVKRGRRDRAKIMLFYGVPGIGKSTQASLLPNAFFVPVEDGTIDLDVAQFEFDDGRVKLLNYQEVVGVLEMVYNNGIKAKNNGEKFPIDNLIIDSVSALEPLIWDLVCQEGDDKGNAKKNIEDFGYSGGYKRAGKKWHQFFNMIETIRNDLNINVIMIGHSQVKSMNVPDQESYDRYTPELHKDALGILQKNCDAVLFANYKTVIRKVDGKMGQKENKVLNNESPRLIYTSEMPAFIAKSRSNPPLPLEMPMDLNNILNSWSKDLDQQ